MGSVCAGAVGRSERWSGRRWSPCRPACSFGSGSDAELTLYNAQHEDLVTAMAARLHQGDRHQGRDPRGERLRAGQPDRAGGRRVPGRRVRHRELAGHDAGGRQGPVRARRAGHPRPGPGRSTPVRRRLGRLRRPRDRPRLQPEAAARATTCRRRSWTSPSPRWKGRFGIARRRRRLPGHRQRGARAQGRRGHRGVAGRPEDERRRSTGATRGDAGRQRRRDRRPASSTTTTGTRTGPSRATTADNDELHFFGGKDPGAFISVSGAGVLGVQQHAGRGAEARGLPHRPRAASRCWPTATRWSTRSAAGSPANPTLKPLAELDPPTVDLGKLNGPKVGRMMQEAGML